MTPTPITDAALADLDAHEREANLVTATGCMSEHWATGGWLSRPECVRYLALLRQYYPALRQRLADLEAERDQARTTNTRLNKRCQSAEAALTDARNIINEMATKGTPWVGGNFGRALLAHRVSQLEEELAKAMAERDEVREQLRRTIEGL